MQRPHSYACNCIVFARNRRVHVCRGSRYVMLLTVDCRCLQNVMCFPYALQPQTQQQRTHKRACNMYITLFTRPTAATCLVGFCVCLYFCTCTCRMRSMCTCLCSVLFPQAFAGRRPRDRLCGWQIRHTHIQIFVNSVLPLHTYHTSATITKMIIYCVSAVCRE